MMNIVLITIDFMALSKPALQLHNEMQKACMLADEKWCGIVFL